MIGDRRIDWERRKEGQSFFPKTTRDGRKRRKLFFLHNRRSKEKTENQTNQKIRQSEIDGNK